MLGARGVRTKYFAGYSFHVQRFCCLATKNKFVCLAIERLQIIKHLRCTSIILVKIEAFLIQFL